MTITLKNSPTLPAIPLYNHVSVATGSKIVFVSGQVSWDAEGTAIAPGDLKSQVEQVYVNAAAALSEVGATFEDVVKVKLHVVDLQPEQVDVVVAGRQRAVDRLGTTATPPLTLIGVTALDVPEHLVELEVIAVLD